MRTRLGTFGGKRNNKQEFCVTAGAGDRLHLSPPLVKYNDRGRRGVSAQGEEERKRGGE